MNQTCSYCGMNMDFEGIDSEDIPECDEDEPRVEDTYANAIY